MGGSFCMASSIQGLSQSLRSVHLSADPAAAEAGPPLSEPESPLQGVCSDSLRSKVLFLTFDF